MTKEVPITKEDLHYNPQTQEISVKREKFDRLMCFVSDLLEELESTQDARAISDYHARRASALNNVYKTVCDDIEVGSQAISKWANEHSINELSRRSGVPYATCHRIINRRLLAKSISVSTFAKLLQAVGDCVYPLRLKATEAFPIKNVVLMKPETHGAEVAANLGKIDVEVVQVESGPDVAAATKGNRPDIIIVESSLPKLKTYLENVLAAAADAPVLIVSAVSEEKLTESAGKVLAVAAGSGE